MSNKLSPSKIHLISQCKLRFILSSQKVGGTGYSNVFNRYSFLGVLLHGVLEDFIKSNLDISEFDCVWNRQLGYFVNKYYINAGLQLSLAYQLPYYVIKKEKLRRYIDNLLKVKGTRMLAEVPVVGTSISGFADLIDDDPIKKCVNIIDLKTGPIWELSKGEIIKLKEGYRIQLLTYGTAYWEKGYRSEDIVCTVQGLSKDEHIEMTFGSEEYAYHQKFLKLLIAEIEVAKLTSDLSDMAFPAVDSCKYCEHAFKCSALHKKVKEDEMLDAPFAVIDEINCEFDDLNSKINITTNGGITSIHRIPNELFIEIKNKVGLGSSLFVEGLFVLSHSRIKYWTRYSIYNPL
jgi:hypothetical protein